VPEEVIEPYIASVRTLAASLDASVERLSDLMEGAPAIGAGESPEEFVLPSKWQRVRAMLTLQAGKLFADADERAAAYELANLREGGAMLRAYPTGIFLHTGLPELRPLLCSLPMIHIYTGPNRKTRKPWFEGGDETSAADTAL
jgi:hypothetical protein